MPGPLHGLRILDFTWALAGPYGSMILTDLGADVIKVEPAGIDEQHRGAGPYVHGVSTYFFSVNRGKKSLTLDLKTPEAIQIIRDLIDPANGAIDVLTENFRPGAMQRLGLGYDDLSQLNPRLIYASTSGFGHTGPYKNRPAVDVIVQGMGGVMSITGHPGGPPTRPGYSIGDMAGGMYTAIGLLAALHERQTSGLGQHVDVAMLDSQVALLENAVVRAANTDEVPGPIGTRHPLVTPFQALPTADGHCVVAGVKDWQLFCAKIDRLDLLDDPRFQTNADRTAHHADIEPILNDAFAKRSTAEWEAELEGVCIVAPLNTLPQIIEDPHIAERGMIAQLPIANGNDTLKVSASPVHLSRTPIQLKQGASTPAEHTAEVLHSIGRTDAEIAQLAESGAISLPDGEPIG